MSRVASRGISIFRPLQDSLREPLKVTHDHAHGHDSTDMWRKVFYFACIPSILLCGINVLLQEEKKLPPFKPYEHLRIRNVQFPWRDGKKSLFYNPHTNAEE